MGGSSGSGMDEDVPCAGVEVCGFGFTRKVRGAEFGYYLEGAGGGLLALVTRRWIEMEAPSSPNAKAPTRLQSLKQIPQFIQESTTLTFGTQLSYAFEVICEAVGVYDLFLVFRLSFRWMFGRGVRTRFGLGVGRGGGTGHRTWIGIVFRVVDAPASA
jgi:hypothetical protein